MVLLVAYASMTATGSHPKWTMKMGKSHDSEAVNQPVEVLRTSMRKAFESCSA